MSKQLNNSVEKVDKILSRGCWQGIGAIVGIVGVIVAIIALNSMNTAPPFTPTITPTSSSTQTPQNSAICTVEEFTISPSSSNYSAGTLLTLYGRGNCPGNIRASRFNIDGGGYSEDAGAAEQSDTWRVIEGEHSVCFEIAFAKWEVGARECVNIVGITESIATSTPMPTTTATSTTTVTMTLTLTETPSHTPPSIPIVPTATATAGYPCDGQILISTGALLNKVKILPQKNAPSRPAVQQGSNVVILGKQINDGLTWYQIRYQTRTEEQTGWIPVDYVTAQSNCPT